MLIDDQLKDIGRRSAPHIEVESSANDLAQVELGEQDAFLIVEGAGQNSPKGEMMALPRDRSPPVGCEVFESLQIGGYMRGSQLISTSTKQRPSQAMWRRVACQESRASAVGPDRLPPLCVHRILAGHVVLPADQPPICDSVSITSTCCHPSPRSAVRSSGLELTVLSQQPPSGPNRAGCSRGSSTVSTVRSITPIAR